MTHLGIDYTAAIHQTAGIGRYVREMVKALTAHQTPYHYHLFAANGLNHQPEFTSHHNISWHSTRITRRWLERLWYRLHLPLPVELWTGSLDIFHQPDFVLPPTRAQAQTIVTIHDLSFVRLPSFTMPGMLTYLNRWVPYSVKKADHVIAVSKATKQDLIELYQTPPDKISVLYHGITSEFRPIDDETVLQAVRQKYGLHDNPFILTVGTIHPRKNFQRLVEAFAQLQQDVPDLLLVIVGGQGWQCEVVFNEVKRQRVEPYVRFLGFADDTDLPALYNAAMVFAYPSLYEGFGLPVLEAMACGTPVVSSNASALPEVVGTAGFLVEPDDVKGLTNHLGNLLINESERERLSEMGLHQAQQFSWEKMAEGLLGVYQQL